VKHRIEVAYLGIEVPDPSSLDSFFGQTIGLAAGEPTASGARTWRNDHKAQRVIVTEGPANDGAFVGFETVDDAAFDEAVARLGAAGFAVTTGDAAECAERRVARLARVTSPWGVPVEVVTGLADAATPFDSPLVPGGFLTEGMGFGHVVFATPEFDEACRFLTEGLGLAQSDWLEMPLGPDMTLEVRFFHCNGRHHTMALARAPFPFPQQLHHFMVETNSRDDVGAAFDRAWATELPIPNGLGRHDNDGMFSFYVSSPAGFAVEVGFGGRIVTDDWDDNRMYDRISQWGHQPLRQG
jgi:2,3-dihydroxybiphenyl 1,2-dioxygenase